MIDVRRGTDENKIQFVSTIFELISFLFSLDFNHASPQNPRIMNQTIVGLPEEQRAMK